MAGDAGETVALLQTSTAFPANILPEPSNPLVTAEQTASAAPYLASAQYEPALFASNAPTHTSAVSDVIVLPSGKRRSHGIVIAITSPEGAVAEFYAELSAAAESGTTVSVLQ